MTPEARAKVSKELGIQLFQEEMTKIAIKMAGEKLAERERKEESKKEDIVMAGPNQGDVGTGGPNPGDKPLTGPKQGTGGTNSAKPSTPNRYTRR